MALVRMVHPRLGERSVPKHTVHKYRQNGWALKPKPKKSKAENPPEKQEGER